MICRDCDDEFNKKILDTGFKDQCDDCTRNFQDEPKYLGFNDGTLNKSTHISIYRGTDEKIRKKISNQKARVS